MRLKYRCKYCDHTFLRYSYQMGMLKCPVCGDERVALDTKNRKYDYYADKPKEVPDKSDDTGTWDSDGGRGYD